MTAFHILIEGNDCYNFIWCKKICQFDTFAQKGAWSNIHMCYLNLLLYVYLIVLRWLCYLWLYFVLCSLYFSVIGWGQENRVQVTGVQSMIITLTYFVPTFKWSPLRAVSQLYLAWLRHRSLVRAETESSLELFLSCLES